MTTGGAGARRRISGGLRAAVRVGLIVGVVVDLFVGLLALAAQGLIAPLLDVPVKDPGLTRLFGGELLVAAAVYALPLVDLRRFGPALWICALDQAFAALLPAVEIVRGEMPGTWKTIAPIPLDAALCALFLYAALRTRAPEPLR